MDDAEIVERIAGRVILIDPQGRALLFQGFDPGRPETYFPTELPGLLSAG